ncbi:MAG: MFS transporter [Muribaculaceae bacterium]|nr:MFS transporter [Muribaculaceae bacterium]
MSQTVKAKRGLLENAFTSSKWNSKITSANTTKKEMWLGYVIGVWGMMMTNSIVNSYFNQYLTDVIGFTASKGAWIASFMILFPVLSKLLDAVTNLVMSKLIDSTTCRQGKVRPWLVVSAPLIAVCIVLLFWMPFQSIKAQAVWIVVMFNLYYSVAYTMWNMSKDLMPAVSTRNVLQRRNLSMASTIVGNVGTGLVSILFPMILAGICAAVNGDNAKGYLISMTIFGILGMMCAFVQYFYTRERVTEERRNPDDEQ